MSRAQSQDKFIVRLPPGMRDQIKADAKVNARSMNAEIIALLTERGDRLALRDWFAGQALAAIIQADGIQFANRMTEHAQFAYAQADAMLAEREKGGAA
ncbi:MAG TPA: Arc family DNA-binding protein [Rhizobiaceae bacterium]|nr:Arc family DNA-binding protein [Rhizobiaceae bacterium]